MKNEVDEYGLLRDAVTTREMIRYVSLNDILLTSADRKTPVSDESQAPDGHRAILIALRTETFHSRSHCATSLLGKQSD